MYEFKETMEEVLPVQTNLNKGQGKYFGPDDELPANVKNDCIAAAKSYLLDNDEFNLTKNLEKDPIEEKSEAER